jgi:hypothetical protein
VIEQKFTIVPSDGSYTISAAYTGSSATSVLYVDSTAGIQVNDFVYGLTELTTTTQPVVQSIGEKTVTINNTLSSTITNAQSIVVTRPIVVNLPVQDGYRIIRNDYTGPTLQFSTATNGTFATALSVVVTGNNSINEVTTVTTTATVTMTRNAPTTQNLGSWKSALQPFNGIIGASYDVIDGSRYITIGYGLGADGSSSLGNDPSGTSAFVEFLGINTDTVTVDNKEYEFESLSEETRAQFVSLQFADQEIAQLQARLAAMQTARNAYAQALGNLLTERDAVVQ